MEKYLDLLRVNKNSCFLKKDTGTRCVSIAITSNWWEYIWWKIESYNHLLDIPSELCAVVHASQLNDYKVVKVITMIFSDNEIKQYIDPSVVKLLIDHSARTWVPIEYIVVLENWKIINSIKDVNKEFPYYKAEVDLLAKIEFSEFESNRFRIDNYENLDEKWIIELLREYSKLWIPRNFPTNSKSVRDPTRPPSWYWAAIITDKWNLYFWWQYSTPDHRYWVHAEPSVFVSALMNNDTNIIYLWLSSSKHQEDSCELCWCCRQFYSEIESRTWQKTIFYTFSWDWNIVNKYDNIWQLLPWAWSSKT